MFEIRLESETDFVGWRTHARGLAARLIEPGKVVWSVKTERADLFSYDDYRALPISKSAPVTAPSGFVSLAETSILHNDPQRFAHLYGILWRLQSEPRLLSLCVDRDVVLLEGMVKAVRRDIHKMRAFVRFRRTTIEGEEAYVAWFEPDHHILAANAPFFVRRFANMRWSILTPLASAFWDGSQLAIGEGAKRAQAPADDELEELWRDYYAHIFNPARLKTDAMRSEMPVKYWKNLPEAELIKPLIGAARRREAAMVAAGGSAPNPRPQRGAPQQSAPQPQHGTLDAVRVGALACRACPLAAAATQTVFGEGAIGADLMFVGEQPGDEEDIQGRPFIGPAGRLLDRALIEAGIDRSRAYVTNAVKHFKYIPRGKRRIHQKPDVSEINICRSWLTHEIELVRPRLIVALGASAALSVVGRRLPVKDSRAKLLTAGDGRTPTIVTVHPSYLLRLPDEAQKAAAYSDFVADLKNAKQAVAALAA